MMDSDYIPPDDDYDIDLDGGEAYSNTGDDEMKFDMVDDPIQYDNDDLMLDEADYQISTITQEEMMTESNALQDTQILSFDISATGTQDTHSGPLPDSIEVVPELTPLLGDGAQADPSFLSQQASNRVSNLGPAEPIIDVTEGEKDHQSETEISGVDSLQGPNFAFPETHVEVSTAQATKAVSPVESLATEADAEPVASDSASISPAAPKIHPIIVQYEANTMALFHLAHYITYSTPEQTYPEIPSVFLLSDVSVYPKPFDEVFAVLRDIFGSTIGDDKEITIEFESLELFLHEVRTSIGIL